MDRSITTSCDIPTKSNLYKTKLLKNYFIDAGDPILLFAASKDTFSCCFRKIPGLPDNILTQNNWNPRDKLANIN